MDRVQIFFCYRTIYSWSSLLDYKLGGVEKRGYDYGEYKPETFGISEKVSEGEQTEQDENLKGKKASVSKRIVLWISKKWESLNRS